MEPLGPLGRYSLVVGMVFSVLGVVASLLGGLVYLVAGHPLLALALVFLSAPYSFAMYTVFGWVLDRSRET